MIPEARAEDPTAFGAGWYAPVARALRPFDARQTIASIAGLLTVPGYQPVQFRIEMLLHLACCNCRGKKRPSTADLAKWLEVMLADTPARYMEDPPEDVFVSNVIGPGGNYRIFEGLWEVNDFYLQEVLDCVGRTRLVGPNPEFWAGVHGLLTLSDAVAERSGLARWASSARSAPSDRFLLKKPGTAELLSRVTFTFTELAALGVSPVALAPFLLQPKERENISKEKWGNSSLERHPLVRFGEVIVLACPTAVSVALRYFVLEWFTRNGRFDAFVTLLRDKQRTAVIDDALPDISESIQHFRGTMPDNLRPVGKGLPVEDIVCAIDTDKLAYIVLLHDDPAGILIDGVGSQVIMPTDTMHHISEHLGTVAHALRGKTVGGLTLVVQCGLGRGMMVGLPEFPDRWHAEVLSLADLVTFASSEEASLLRVWKLNEQMDAAVANGLSFAGLNGLLNLYAYWRHHDYRLVPPQAPYPAQPNRIQIGSDFVRGLRTEVRTTSDVHAVLVTADSGHASVRRLHERAFFRSLREQPVYASADLAKEGELAGVVEGQKLTLWIWAPRPEFSQEAVGFLYQVWEALLGWVSRALPHLERFLGGRSPAPLHVHLAIPDEESWTEFGMRAGEGEAVPPRVQLDAEHNVVNVDLPFGFLGYFRRPSNDAERMLLEGICDGILHLLPISSEPGDPRAITDVVIGGSGARSIHLYSAPTPVDDLGEERTPRPRLIQPEDQESWRAGLAWRVLPPPESRREELDVEGKDACNKVLHGLVDEIWAELRDRLQQIDASSLIQRCLENSDAIARDRLRWKRTSRALQALHDDVGEVASAREAERAMANLACRVLVEMAVPTCPVAGGRHASLADLDALIAGVSLMVDLASDSDAIRGGFADATLAISPSGLVAADHAFRAEIANPYVLESFGVGFRAAAETYESLYRKRGEKGEPDALHLEEPEFAAAFLAEYGLAPSRLIDILAEFIDFAREEGRSVLISTRGAVAARLRESRGLEEAEIDAFFTMATLTPRPQWDKAPQGFAERDWQPWKYRRRLSHLARPVVLLGADEDAPLLCGIQQLAESASYILEGSRKATLTKEFFVSKKMRKYWGAVVNERGHAFTRKVAAALNANGWETRIEVEMRELLGPKDWGDIDVVAWHPDDPRVLLIECKRLQQVRSTSEIIEHLKEFAGDPNDRLGVHLRRIGWVEEHLPEAWKRLGLPHPNFSVWPLLVTNVDVPSQFKRDLPLQTEQIIPLRVLAERVTK